MSLETESGYLRVEVKIVEIRVFAYFWGRLDEQSEKKYQEEKYKEVR